MLFAARLTLPRSARLGAAVAALRGPATGDASQVAQLGLQIHGYPGEGRCNVTGLHDQLKAHWVSPSRACAEKMQTSSWSAARASTSAQPAMVAR